MLTPPVEDEIMMSKARDTLKILEDERNVGNAVRNTVRNMAYNLENVITNLHGIVGDLHVLVAQIDSVTSKIDGRNGLKYRENGRTSCVSSLDKSTTKSSPSHGIKHWQSVIETYETPDFSPDLDWSYLGLTETEKFGSMDKLSGSPHLQKPANISPLVMSYNVPMQSTECSKPSKILRTLETGCSSKSEFFKNLSPLSDVGAANGAACCYIENALPCGGYYEQILEDILENLDCEVEDSDFSDDETISGVMLQSPSTSSSSRESYDRDSSVSSVEFQAEYDRQVNPWTTFSTVVNAVDSEDAFSVDDILNDNYIDSKYCNYSFEESFKTLEVT